MDWRTFCQANVAFIYYFHLLYMVENTLFPLREQILSTAKLYNNKKKRRKKLRRGFDSAEWVEFMAFSVPFF